MDRQRRNHAVGIHALQPLVLNRVNRMNSLDARHHIAYA